MVTRIIVQSSHFPDGLVLKLEEELLWDVLRLRALELLPEACHVDGFAGFEVFDEAHGTHDGGDFHDAPHPLACRSLHVGRCHEVEVKVRYAGHYVSRHFAPTARIGRVKNWAVHALGISSHDANELVLQVAGSDTQPSRDKHVGSFVHHGTCTVELDLVRNYTVNGDGSFDAGLAVFNRHRDEAPLTMGEMDGRWTIRDVAWPIVLADVFARDGRPYTLRLDCTGYPQAPTGAFWDVARQTWLAADHWPKASGRFGAALRTDWQYGQALYLPCDRRSIAGHEQWTNMHPAWTWQPEVGLARYLEVVWVLLNGEDYVAPAC